MGDRLLQIFDVINWTQLPSQTQPIARMLVRGLAQTEISRALGIREEEVGRVIRELRLAMTEQALEHADELDAELRAYLHAIRSNTPKSTTRSVPSSSCRTCGGERDECSPDHGRYSKLCADCRRDLADSLRANATPR
jgi:hypothetical protein